MSPASNNTRRYVELRKIASFVSGGTPSRKTESYFSGSVPWLTGFDIPEDQVTYIDTGREDITEEAIKESATNLVEAGTVLLTTRVTVGKVGIANTKVCFSQDITGIKISDTRIITSEYLAYYLMAIRGLLLRKNRGSTIQGIIRRDLARLIIPLPTIPEQQRIVDILRQAEDLRKLRLRADIELKVLYHSIFYDMFGNMMKSSKEMKLIKDISTLVTSGLTPRGGEAVYVAEGPYFIRSQNVLMNKLDLTDVSCITPEMHYSMIRTKVLSGDVLFNITGASIGRVAWVEDLDREANVNQHVCIIRPKKEKVLPEYLSVYISLPVTQDYIMHAQAGASRQALNHEQVRRLKIFVPPIENQKEFVRRIKLARVIIETPNDISSLLIDLLRSISERAFSGNLTT
jgi:type I restriction enzyme S subunit